MKLLSKYLKKQDIPFTKSFLSSVIKQYPYAGSLWVYHKVLEDYNIPNISYKINRKELVDKVSSPFFAEFDNQIILVDLVTEKYVSFYTNTKKNNEERNDFLKKWTGVVLEPHPNKDSCEPMYKKNHKSELYKLIRFILFLASIFLLISFTLLQLVRSNYIIDTSYLLTYLTGVWLSILLLKKHLHIHSWSAQKLCQLIPGGDCSHIASNSDKIRIFKEYTLSECGVAYFLTNILFCIVFPITSIGIQCILAICCISFSIWSILYQWKILRNWCALCLCTIAVLWMQTLLLYLKDSFQSINKSNIENILVMGIAWGCTFYIILYCVHGIVLLYKKKGTIITTLENCIRIKYDPEVFLTQLIKNKKIETTNTKTILIFGDKTTKKPIITIVANPFCHPCALLHDRLETLINRGFCIEYFLSYFKESFSDINREIIATYYKYGSEITWEKMSSWYHLYQLENIHFDDSLLQEDIHNELVETEFNNHIKWLNYNRIRATPLVLVDGHPLPSNYQIEDLYRIY